jgi:hypothetical protein
MTADTGGFRVRFPKLFEGFHRRSALDLGFAACGRWLCFCPTSRCTFAHEVVVSFEHSKHPDHGRKLASRRSSSTASSAVGQAQPVTMVSKEFCRVARFKTPEHRRCPPGSLGQSRHPYPNRVRIAVKATSNDNRGIARRRGIA